MALHELPADLRPRERLMAHGPAALADAELLALLLRTGLPGRNVLQLAEDLLERFGGLAGLLRADAQRLADVKGLGGSAKRAQILAVLELARRVLLARLQRGSAIESVGGLHEYLRLRIGTLPHETFLVLFLDQRHRLIRAEEMFRGTLAGVHVYPREVARRALELNAAAVILAHNHPTDLVRPSPADKALTALLKAALDLIDVRVLDHVVTGATRTFSFAEEGLL